MFTKKYSNNHVTNVILPSILVCWNFSMPKLIKLGNAE